VQLSAGDSWGWYDHRLHPEQIRAPADPSGAVRLGEFQVPVRYGERRSVVGGHVQFSPLLGAFQVTADPAPSGLVVQALPGKLPGLFLSNPERLPLTVLGRDGEPFLRFSEAGVEVNESSRTHVEDRQARGLPAGPPAPEPAFRLISPGGTSYTWLDARLRYPADLPPLPVLRAAEPTAVDDWTVPVQLAGGPLSLTGEVTWVPEASAAASVVAPRDDGSGRLPLVLALGSLAVLGLAVLAVRVRRA